MARARALDGSVRELDGLVPFRCKKASLGGRGGSGFILALSKAT